MWSRKKNVARPSESLCLAREMAESTECPTCDGVVGVARTVRCRFPPAPLRSARRLADHGRLDDSGANRRARSHCLHASHWIVIFVVARRRRANRVHGAFGAAKGETVALLFSLCCETSARAYGRSHVLQAALLST